MTDRFVTADGVNLYLDSAGEGAPFVFQHGLCGDCGQAAQVFPEGFRRLTLECRGHGASECGPLERLSIAQFTDDLAAMIEAEGLGPCVVGGISMGAAIALRLAVTRGDLVRALVLARPAWDVEPAPENMAPNALVGDLLGQFAPELAAERFEASPIALELARTGPDNLASLRGFFRREPVAVTAALLSRISADGPGVTSGDLGALRLPVLVIGHERDHVHPIAMARGLAGMIPGARFIEITPKAADPARYRTDFQSALSDFLKGLP